MDINKKLRRALIGGFNSGDVVAYIDTLTEQHRRETAELRRELDRVTEERDAALRDGGDAAGVRRSLEEAEASLAEKSSELERAASERDALRGELEGVRAKLERYESADTELEEKLAELERVKARVTDIELEAHERARVIEKNAAERAENVRRESGELLRDVCRRYGAARSSAAGAIGDSLAAVDRLRGGLEELLRGLDGIGEKLGEIDPGKPEDEDDGE